MRKTQLLKIVGAWNSQLVPAFLDRAIEISRQYLRLRADFLQKKVVGCR